MITIDCSIGAGSPVRLAAGLAAARDRPVRLKNIFTDRETPGMTPQQVAGVRAVADLTDAETEGLERGSTEVVFDPHGISNRSVSAEIPDGGPVSLALQPVMIAATAAEKPVTFRVKGGSTAGRRAPTIHYMDRVVLPFLSQYGYKGAIDVERHGFSSGGAAVEVTLDGSGMDWIDCTERDPVETVCGVSWASEDLSSGSVAERQRMTARKRLTKELPGAVDVSVETAYVDTGGTGCAVQLWADTPRTGLGGSGIGEDDDDAETAGEEAGRALAYAIMADGPLDTHMSDQVIPFLGLTGGTVRVQDFTDRVVANIAVTRAFTPYTMDIDPEENRITVR